MSWCPVCNYGSASCRLTGPRCPQCGAKLGASNNPLDKNPIRQEAKGFSKKKEKAEPRDSE